MAIVEPIIVVAPKRVPAAEGWKHVERHLIGVVGTRKHSPPMQSDDPSRTDDRNELQRLDFIPLKTGPLIVPVRVDGKSGTVEAARHRVTWVVAEVRDDRCIAVQKIRLVAHARITPEHLPRVRVSPVEPSRGSIQCRLMKPAESSNDRQPLIRPGHGIADNVGTLEAILRAARLERVGPDAEIVDLGDGLPTNL